MGNSCSTTPDHEDAARYMAEVNELRRAKMALAIASDYESWKCLRRAIKWYNAYQRNMACYLFVQFKTDFNDRLQRGEYDIEELDGLMRDEVINHAQEARNMYAYREELCERYRKINEFQDPPALERPARLPYPQWAMWVEMISWDECEDEADLEDFLERMGLLKIHSRKTVVNIMHKQAEEEAAAAAVKQSTKVHVNPKITVNPTISPNIIGATASPSMAQSGSGSATAGAGGASSTTRHSGGSGESVPMMQPIQTPSGPMYPVMTPQGLMYVPMAPCSSYGAAPPPAASYGYAHSAPPMAAPPPAQGWGAFNMQGCTA